LWFATARQQRIIDRSSIDLNGAAITPSSSVRDLGVLLSCEMSIANRVNKVVSFNKSSHAGGVFQFQLLHR